MADTAPHTTKLTGNSPSAIAAADAALHIGEAPYIGEITGVSYTPVADVTGDNTESRTLTLVNRGQTGAGVTVAATLAFVTGVDGTEDDELAFTLGVAANLDLADGDVLEFVSTSVGGTGLADPGGHVQVEISRGLS